MSKIAILNLNVLYISDIFLWFSIQNKITQNVHILECLLFIVQYVHNFITSSKFKYNSIMSAGILHIIHKNSTHMYIFALFT